MSGAPTKNILGGQGCLWADQLLGKKHKHRNVEGEKSKRSEAYFEYLTMPRCSALAEVTWTAKEKRHFGDLQERRTYGIAI